MSGHSSHHPHSSNNLPPSPWNTICDPVLAQHISSIPAGSPCSPHARDAETARAASSFTPYNHNIPLAEGGFHGGFIREPRACKETRERIVGLMQSLVRSRFLCYLLTVKQLIRLRTKTIALEVTCGASSTVVVFHGEMNPNFSSVPTASLDLECNVRCFFSDVLTRSQVFQASISNIRHVCLDQVGPAYMHDFCRCGQAARYFSNPRYPQLIEDLEPTQSLIGPPSAAQPPPPPSDIPSQPSSQPLSGTYDFPHPETSSTAPPRGASTTASLPPYTPYNPAGFSTPGSPSGEPRTAPTPAQSPGGSHSSHMSSSSAYKSILSPLSNMSMQDLPGSLSSSHSRRSASGARSDSDASGSPSRPRGRPDSAQHVVDLLMSLGQQELEDAVMNMHRHIGCSARLRALRDLGFNKGTAIALAYLMG
ncbi:hypothetical protein DENSPDRAFT_851211 [Dentipellis sp. KUC8613]|nr:hypothetical protein DENSPDRAFT_851211 [Dentipellis sp. KUC8613]